MKRITWLTLLVAFSLFLAACGASEPATVAEPEPAVVEESAEEMEEMAEEEMAEEEIMEEPLPSIAEIAVASGSFNTLVAALDAAGLVDTFAGEGSFTLFAPTDSAFAALPEGTVAALLEDPEGALTQILTYHVVDGAVFAETVVTLDSATTLQGEDIAIAINGNSVMLNDAVTVTATDIEASNGVIHMIDAVLLPPTIAAAMEAEAMAEEEMMEEEMMEEALPTIAEIAVEAGSFNTLVAALDAAGLVETFAGEGSFTVFAPTDNAFAALPEGTVEALLEDPQGALTQILTYHVVDGAVFAETVVSLDSATTLQGEDITIAVEDGSVILNGAVTVTATDIEASNGVIHMIDAVLLPPSVVAAAEEAAMAEEEAMMAELSTIAEIAVEAGTFNTLVAALDAAGLVETFAGEGSFTVFAPTDDAFAALPEGTIEALLEDPSGALTEILLYHVVEGAVLAETVVTLDAAPTLLGKDVTITIEDGNVILNDSVMVTATDIKASNGVIHVIDAVLLPPEEMADDMDGAMSNTIVDIAVADGRFTTLVAAVQAAELVETLSSEGPFTVFAPTDDAFAALPEGTVASLLEDPSGALTDILLYHVVAGAVLAEDVVTMDMAPTVLGQNITIMVDGEGRVLLNDTVQVIITDIEADNGVIHVIDAVLIPASE